MDLPRTSPDLPPRSTRPFRLSHGELLRWAAFLVLVGALVTCFLLLKEPLKRVRELLRAAPLGPVIAGYSLQHALKKVLLPPAYFLAPVAVLFLAYLGEACGSPYLAAFLYQLAKLQDLVLFPIIRWRFFGGNRNFVGRGGGRGRRRGRDVAAAAGGGGGRPGGGRWTERVARG